ncbi:MAG TPA: SpoIIE family protein phosphatase [Acidimicrobiales bacterium]|nr:SpoIIE family protein phosphatase [Acidimicrobiales bacterium]
MTETAIAAPGPGAIYEAALDAIVDTLGSDRAAVLLFDPDGVIRFKASRGLSEDYKLAVEGHTPWSPDETAAKPVLISDVSAAEDLGELQGVILDEGIGAVAFVPLVYADRLLGKFMAYFRGPHTFTADEVEFAQTVAAHIAFALEQRRLEDQLRVANDELIAILHAVGEAITVQSRDGKLLFANDAAGRLLGFTNGEELRSASTADIMNRFAIFDEAGEPVGVERLPGRLALGGKDPPEVLLRYRVLATGVERHSLVKASPVTDAAGKVRFAVNVFRDVTERERALTALRHSEARLELLASTSRKLLAASLDHRSVLDAVADVFVPELADACTVWEMNNDDSVEASTGRPTAGGAASALPELVVSEAIRAGQSLLVPDAGQSVIVVPLEARGHPVGGVTLVRSGRPYETSDLALVEDVARRAALAIDNARLFSERSQVAETLQKALLPPRLPDVPGLELAARYHPAASEVGGDFYDILEVGPQKWMFIVGDVCGKGIEAASLTAVARSTVQALSLEHERPSELLRAMNSVLLRQLAADRFCTITCVLVDASGPTPRMTMSLAGQPRPLLVRAGGEVSLAGRHGTVLGILPTVDVHDDELTLGGGDSLVLYTDGCFSAGPDATEGEESLVAATTVGGATTVSALASRVEAAGLSGDADDVTVLALRVT